RVRNIDEHGIKERKNTLITPVLNDFMGQILKRKPLAMRRGVELKIKYATQVKSEPPVFIFFMNLPKELPANYRRYIENKIREEFGFDGVPITMRFKEK